MNTLTNEQIHKELDLIQDVIKRMADNSFKVKAWLIGILGAIIAFKADDLFVGKSVESVWLSALLLLPIICFWYLDSFFLSTEKKYIALYNWVVEHRPLTDKYLYNLNTFTRNSEIIKTESIYKVSFSITIWPFYIVPTIFALAILGRNICACI